MEAKTDQSPALITLIQRYFQNPELRRLAARVIDPHPFTTSAASPFVSCKSFSESPIQPVVSSVAPRLRGEDVDTWDDVDVESEQVASPVLLKFQKPTDDARKVVGKMVFNEEAQRWENTAKDEEEDFMAGFSDSNSDSETLASLSQEEGDANEEKHSLKTDPRSKREKKSSITEAGDPRRRLKSDPFKLTEEELEEFRLSEKLHKEQMKPMHDFEPMDPDTLLQLALEKLVLEAQSKRDDSHVTQQQSPRKATSGRTSRRVSIRNPNQRARVKRKSASGSKSSKPPWL